MTPETQRELIEIGDHRKWACVEILLEDPDLLPELQVRMAKELVAEWGYWGPVSRLLERTDLLPQTQLLLALHGNAHVRARLASKVDLCLEAETVLARDTDVDVGQCLAVNVKGLSLGNQMRLARHPRQCVRRALGRNYSKKLLPNVLAELACDSNPDVRLKAVENNTIPAFSPLAFHLVADRSPRVRRAAVEAGRLTQQRGTLATELPMRLETLPIEQSAERAVGVEEPETGEVIAV